MVRRTVMFSPGDQPDLLRKAPGAGADVVVFDLEDAVAPSAKESARETVSTVVSEISPDCELCVRINPLGSGGEKDIEALSAALESIDSLMLPKVASPEDVTVCSQTLDEYDSSLPVLAILESAKGVLAAADIAAVDATDALLIGAEDLSADVGLTRTAEGTEILYAREHVVLAAASQGIDAIDTLFTDFQDTEGLAEDTEFAVQLGFDGKMAIHPAQVPVINDAFTPADDQIEWAKDVIAAREEAERTGRGVFSVDGEMIDAPLIAQAEDVLTRARAAGMTEE